MSIADIQYANLVKEIIEHGFYDNGSNRTGIPTKKLFGKHFVFDLSQEFPILTTKKIFFKSLVKEIIWIYVKGSNKIADLGAGIWDEWALSDGTIGRAYGYQARHWYDYNTGKEIDQVERLIWTLKNKPHDRGMIISLWNVADLPYMALRPCAFLTMWDVTDGYLNCTLVQRSADVGLGVPFNFTQYAVLVHMLAHVTGLKPGKLVHYMNNAHIYENHIEALKMQIQREPYPAPRIWINPEVKDFFDFTPDDIKLVGYKHHPKIDLEVAV